MVKQGRCVLSHSRVLSELIGRHWGGRGGDQKEQADGRRMQADGTSLDSLLGRPKCFNRKMFFLIDRQ